MELCHLGNFTQGSIRSNSIQNNKMDWIRLLLSPWKEVGHCYALSFTETWMHGGIANSEIQMDVFSISCTEWNASLSGKILGSSLYEYMNNSSCTNDYFCAMLGTRGCFGSQVRTVYIPRELTTDIIIAVYIPPTLLLELMLMLAEPWVNFLGLSVSFILLILTASSICLGTLVMHH